MFKPLEYLFRRIVAKGHLVVIDHRGTAHVFGDGSGPRCVARILDRRTEKRLVLHPQLAVAEAYMEGHLVLEEGRIYDFLAAVLANTVSNPLPRWLESIDHLRRLTKRLEQYNPAGRSQRNVAHHYDIDGRIYDLFLDQDRQYSCAYFPDPNHDLEAAQIAKKRHIAAKLAIAPGMRVLDIGSGWGGLAIYLAQNLDCTTTGITLSAEQLKGSQERARALGLANRCDFRLVDYRHLQGRFDRIVSVGMFEHVGVNHYEAYFERIRDLLTDDGVALVHTIGRTDTPTVTNAFIAKYIFPGGYIPAASEMLPAIERSGLALTDLEVLRLHYAETLRHWRERFVARWDDAVRIKDERFARMWEFYLAGSETAFRFQNLVVFQIQLAKRVETLPIVRDYMAAQEAALATAEGARLPSRPMAAE